MVITNNKVGHDFPTGPLDIIQAWVEVTVTDEAGNVVFHTGQRDEENVIEPGTFMFKAEPVDRYGNLIDRHNLWEMVGVRFKRSLFPGSADTASTSRSTAPGRSPGPPPELPTHEDVRDRRPAPNGRASWLRVNAKLNYRKFDQYLLELHVRRGLGPHRSGHRHVDRRGPRSAVAKRRPK